MTIKDEALGDFLIDVYEDQYVLREVKAIDTTHFLSKGKEGEKEITHGYFVSLEPLVRKVIQIKLSREEKVFTLQEFWQAWVTFNKKIIDMFERLNLPVKEYKPVEKDETD